VEEWFAAAWFRFARGDGHASRARIKEFLSRRIASQPLNLPNAGSVFRNPPGDHAARLIESCGLKGHRIGGAMVSPKHANFIVNMGGARGSEIEKLVHDVRATVLRERGVMLEPEVRMIGEPA
jgi:UDP-N-acetylmuramate dehydrogenase